MSKKKPFQVEGSHPAAPERMSGEVFRFRVSAGLDLSSEARRARESEAHMKAERDAAIADTHEVVDRYEGLLAKVTAERDGWVQNNEDWKAEVAEVEQERDAAIARAEKAEHERDMLALEVGRERSRAEKAEAEVTRLKKQLEYGDVTPASAVAAEVAVLRENNEALGLRVNELEAEATAMRKALECIRNHHTYEDWRVAQEMADAALASDAGKAVLDWKESALRVMAEWHDARGVIGGAQLGDGPMEWAHRVKERLEKAEKEARRFHEWLYSAPIVKETRAQAFEEAAQVAEAAAKMHQDESNRHVAEDGGAGVHAAGIKTAQAEVLRQFAAALRAKAKEGT